MCSELSAVTEEYALSWMLNERRGDTSITPEKTKSVCFKFEFCIENFIQTLEKNLGSLYILLWNTKEKGQ